MRTQASILCLLPLLLGVTGVAAEEKAEPAADETAEISAEDTTLEETPEHEEKKPPSLLGEVSREQIEAAEPGWVAAQVESEVESEVAQALAIVDPEARLTIYFGTWCDDSKRELARFWRVLDEAGFFDVEVRYLAVDRSEKRPPELAEEVGLYWVPTFIVERDGREVGRVVESAAETIERDLLALLSGEAEGVLTGREDGAVPPVDADDDAEEDAAEEDAAEEDVDEEDGARDEGSG